MKELFRSIENYCVGGPVPIRSAITTLAAAKTYFYGFIASLCIIAKLI